MASRTREQRIIDTVACPLCGAAIGERCTRHGSSAEVIYHAHAERRAAWQAAKAGASLACSLCGYVPPDAPPEDEEAERIMRSDVIASRPLVCDACEEVAEAARELEQRKRYRDQRAGDQKATGCV